MVLATLGVDAAILDKRHHPCPNGSGKDRFRFSDRNGSGNYFCSCSDGTKGGMELLKCCNGWSYAQAAKEVEKIVGENPRQPAAAPDDGAVRRLRAVQRDCRAPGFAVRRYLEDRGLETPAALREARLTYWEKDADGKPAAVGEFQAMVAKFVDVDGAPLTYHVTYLDGVAKAGVTHPRKVLKPVRPMVGGSVRLYKPGAMLGVAEGIETAIAAKMMHSIPVWAALNGACLAAFNPPAGIEHVVIFGDTDDSFTGQAAAYALAKRLAAKKVSCEVMLPGFGDWNDALKLKARK